MLRTDNEPRPFERDYPAAFIASRAGLERAVRQRFSGSPPGVSASGIAAARLLAHMTEPTDALELVPSQDPEFNQVWALREPSLDAREHAVVDMASGRVRPPGSAHLPRGRVDAAYARGEMAKDARIGMTAGRAVIGSA